MERNTPVSNLNYLFGPRLNFVECQEQLKLKCKASLPQDIQSSQVLRLHESQKLIGQLKTEDDIFEAYRVFYQLIYECRFDKKKLQKTFISSREKLKNKTKKNAKDIEDKRKNRIANSLKKMGISSDDWKQVLNHENISDFVSLFKSMQKKILQQNFDLVEQGTIKFKHQQVQNDVKVRICILVTDIILLINTMTFMFYPFDQSQNPINNINKQQKLIFDQAMKKFNQNSEYKIINSLTVKILHDQIKALLSQLPVDQKKLRFWYDLELIRQKYLPKLKKIVNLGNSQENSNGFQMNLFQQDWQNLQQKYDQQSIKNFQQDLSFVFKEFSNEIQTYINQIFKKDEEKQVIGKFIREYLILIKNQWIHFDKNSFEKLYKDQLFRLNQILQLPKQFLTEISQNVLQIINKKAKQFSEFKLQQLKDIGLQISKELICLEQHENLVVNYFYRFKQSVIKFFKQKQRIEKILLKIENYQRNFQTSDFFKTIQEIYKLFNQIKQCKVEQIDIKKDQNFDNAIDSLMMTYESDKNLLEQIKYFLKTTRAITNVQVGKDELQSILQFYSFKRNDILGEQNIVDKQKLSTLNYGLVEFIRYLIYELILKIKLQVKISEINKDQRLISKFLKFYYLQREKILLQFKNTMNERQQDQNMDYDQNMVQSQDQDQDQDQNNQDINQNRDQAQNQKVSQKLLRRVKCQEINFDDFHQITNQENNTLPSNRESSQFAQKFLTHIQQLRIQISQNSIKQLQLKQIPLYKNFISLKNKSYQKIITNQNLKFLQQDFNQLGQAEYWFIKKRYHKLWRGIKRLKNIEQILTELEKIKRRGNNSIKICIKIYLRYRQIYYHSNQLMKGDDIPQSQVKNIVDDAIKTETDFKMSKQFMKQLKDSVKILDRIEKVQILRQQITKRQQINRSIQNANKFQVIRENNQFSQLDKFLKIQRSQKMGIPTMKKFIIKCSQGQQKKIQDKLKILKALSLNNIHVQPKGLQTIEMTVDQVQIEFDSIPKLVKYLIETYYKIISFCQKKLEFNLYPILTKNDFHFQNKGDTHYTLRINPYEGILLNLLLSYADLKKSKRFAYPKHPFVPFSDEIKDQFGYPIIQNLKTCKNNVSGQQFGFSHLIQQIKSISMENDHEDLGLIVEKILKCPYFWSSSDKFFQLIQFKQKYHSMVNVEQCRRKQNQRIKKSLSKQQQQTFSSQHKKYTKCPGYGKTVQMYFNIEGIMQKQAFLEDIGNFRTQGNFQQFSPQTYYWALDKHSQEKRQINKLIKMTAQKKNKKMSMEEAYYKLVFPSFHTKIRNLRNLLSHYTYIKSQKKQYTLQNKLSLIQKSFPKLFVFIYRWKPYLNKNFSEIQEWRQNLLLSMFRNQDKNKVINQLKKIDKIKKEYQMFFENLNVAEFFNFKQENINNCGACKVLIPIMVKKKSVWDFLADFKKQKIEQAQDISENSEEKENKKKQKTPYNHLFWQHKSYRCNGMRFLLPFYMNMVKRSKFTSEEAGQIISSKSEIMLQIEKLQQRLKNLQILQNGIDDQLPIVTEKEQKQLQKHLLKMKEKQKEQREKQKKFLLREQNLNVHYQDMKRYDNVNKNTIYQIEWQYPHLFDDLRRVRYQWDLTAKMF